MSLTADLRADPHAEASQLRRSEALLSDLLAGLVETPDDRIDTQIVDAIRRVVERFDFDQGFLIQWDDDPFKCASSHCWTVPGASPLAPSLQPQTVPWLHEQVTVGKSVTFSALDDLPADAEPDRTFFCEQGVHALASLPLKLRGRAIGALVFIGQSEDLAWPEPIVHHLQSIASVLCSLLDRRRRQCELESQLQFERLLAEVAARFVSIPPDEVDAAIEDTQRLICRTLGLDRSSLFQVADQGPDVLLLTHLHQPPGGPPWEKRPGPRPFASTYWASTRTTPPGFVRMDVKTLFPWTYEQLRRNQAVIIHRLEDLPQEAAADRDSFRQYETKSSVVIPLSVDGAWLGCLSFACIRESRHWTVGQVLRFRFLADVIASTLARRRATEGLRENEQRLQLATESAGVGLWRLPADGGRLWLTPQARAIFGFAPDEAPGEAGLLARVHPEDSATWRDAVSGALHTGADLRLDFRVVLADGAVRWIAARAQARRDAAGEPECLIGVAIDITERKCNEADLRHALDELQRLQHQLQCENLCLRMEVQHRQQGIALVGSSERLMKAMRQAEQVAATDATVLVLGETGTGKELLARYMHAVSKRADKPFVAINVAAIPATLLESELFGREKGAYTGALTKEIGRFELADNGTLFLDEIGEMPMETQVKLLRVLQTGEFERLGSGRPLRVDVRVIAATNRKLPELIKAGQFRQDLFYRLNVFPITLPPLRDRSEDVPLLVMAFVRELSEKMGRVFERVRKKDLEALRCYDWPGNVRELHNVVERSMILTEGPELRLILPDGQPTDDGAPSRRLSDVQRHHILKVLESTRNRIHGPGGAAAILGVKPSTLYSLMARLGIPRTR